MKQRSRSAALAAIVLLGALSAAVWIHRVHLDRPERYALQNADLLLYFYPTAVFIHDMLRSGAFPLWDPYQFAGQPFLGLHTTGLLYPPNLILLALASPANALAVHAILHIAVAGIFTWLFLARLGLGIGARYAGALVYMLSAPILQSVYNVAYLSTEAWLPAILWALHGLLSTARFRWGLALAAFLSVGFLGGHAQGFLFEVQFAFAYGLFGLVFVTPRGSRLRVVGLAAASGVIAVGLVGPQLLPTLELTRQGVRSFNGLPFDVASSLALRAGLVLGGLFGALTPLVWPSALLPAVGTQFIVTLPALALPLAVSGIAERRQRANWAFFVLAAVLAGLFLLGRSTPVFRLYYSLPLGNLFRGPVRLSFVYVFTAAVLVAIGIHAWGEGVRAHRTGRVVRVIAILPVLLIAVEVYSRTVLSFAHPVLMEPIAGAPPELVEYLRNQAGHPRVFLEPTWTVRSPALQKKAGLMHHIFVVPDYEAALPQVYKEWFAPDRALWHGDLSFFRHQAQDRPPPLLQKLLDLMSVRYYAVIAGRSRDAVVERLKASTGGQHVALGPVDLFERPAALPRVYVVRQVRSVADFAAALDAVTKGTFRPRTEAVVEPALDPDAAAFPQGRADPAGDRTGTDSAAIERYSTEEVTIAAECSARCLLVLTDLYYPGWRVLVDGREGRILRVNALFRGVWLAAGAHRVVYRYEPRSFRVGVWMLLAALVGAAGLAYAQRRNF